MKSRLRTFFVWFALIGLLAFAYATLRRDREDPIYSTQRFESDVATGMVASVHPMLDGRWQVLLTNNFCYRIPTNPDYDLLEVNDIPVSPYEQCREPEQSSSLGPISYVLIGIGLVVLIFVIVVRRMQKQGRSILQLNKSTARLLATVPNTRFADVGGAEEAKVWLRDVCRFLKDPQSFHRLGARAPRGILLEGPPGVGKTLLARALAGEAGVSFYECSASEFVELFVGVGAARMRDLFEQAKKNGPSVIFIDELDALGRRRGASDTAMAHQEREQTLNQLLVQLDGFSPAGTVVVLAATNRADVLDSALLRPGRFDVRVPVALPGASGREEILRLHARGKALSSEIDLAELAKQCDGYSGAELEFLLNEAILCAMRAERSQVLAVDIEHARARRHRDSTLDTADALLVESVAHFTKPIARTRIGLQFANSKESLEGEVLWAAPQALKLKLDDGTTRIVSRAHVLSVATLSAQLVDEQTVRAGEVPAAPLRVG